MAVVEAITNAAEGLRQGDVLQEVDLCVDEEKGPEYIRCAVLVVSRDCVAERDPKVLVAPLQKYQANIGKDGITFDALRKRLALVRDGEGAPDRFYIGPLKADDPTRYQAQLELLTPLRITTKTAERSAWIAEHRIGRLNAEFIKALPNRVQWSLAKPGFDDYTWYPDDDLLALLTIAKAERAALFQNVCDAEKAVATGKLDGNEAQVLAGKMKGVAAAAKVLADFDNKVKPYADEAAKRNLTF